MTAEEKFYRFAVEKVSLRDRELVVEGWAASNVPLVSLELYLRSNGGRLPIHERGLPSPDLEQHFGAFGSNCRFRTTVEITAWDLATVRSAEILFTFENGARVASALTEPPGFGRAPAWRGGRTPRVGIGITTYNRVDLLERVIEEVRRHTRMPYDFVVCDDGSSDATPQLLRARAVPHICAENRGIAWNKNRALFYLRVVRACDVIILLEDDTVPTEGGWEVNWVCAALMFGHINWAGHWFLDKLAGGWGHWYQPYISRSVSGQCVAFSADAIDNAGYMDTRFGRYGYEHIEHTTRMARNGYGGLLSLQNNEEPHFYLIRGGVETLPSVSHGTADEIAKNGPLYVAALNDLSTRPPWRDDEQRRDLLAEMAQIRLAYAFASVPEQSPPEAAARSGDLILGDA